MAFAREIAVVRDGITTPFTGNDPAAVVMLDEGPMRFEEVMVPARLFRLWDADDPILHGSSTGSGRTLASR